jgi:uncharacterized membrane protein
LTFPLPDPIMFHSLSLSRRALMAWHYVIETVAALIMVGSVGGIVHGVYKGTIASSPRTVQILSVSFALPMVLILSLETRVESGTTSAIIGTVVGYVLSGLNRTE